jgi:ABC-type transport system involved in cytochrome c biogenesis ATPase subunit
MTLLLDSLRIENYRTFPLLEIERLGRATLIVGKNNSGKSSVLEAVRLWASRGNGEVILSILESHDETRIGPGDDSKDRLLAVKQLFHGRDTRWTFDSRIRISDLNNDGLEIRITPATEEPPFPTPGRSSATWRQIAVMSRFGEDFRRMPIEMDWALIDSSVNGDGHAAIKNTHIPPNGLTTENAAKLWDLIALSDLEDDVIAALRIISPEIERISFIGEVSRRIPVAKLRTETKPVALRSLGDGVNRMLGVALSLVEARDGVALLDEVENGIHFSAQRQLWELIFRTAHRLNIQVFATTHSWDCIQAFQRAATEDEHEDAALVRLDMRQGTIRPVTISERDLSIVTEEHIEVR